MSNEFTVAQRHFAERGTTSFRPARRRAFWPEKPTLQTTIIRERRRASRLPSVPSALRGLDPRHALPMFWATIGASPESASASMRTRDHTLPRHRARPRSQRDQAWARIGDSAAQILDSLDSLSPRGRRKAVRRLFAAADFLERTVDTFGLASLNLQATWAVLGSAIRRRTRASHGRHPARMTRRQRCIKAPDLMPPSDPGSRPPERSGCLRTRPGSEGPSLQ